MIQRTNKNEIRARIHKRIRSKVRGTPQRPRLAVFRSLSHIYAQLIDDTKGQTVVAVSSSEAALFKGASVNAPPDTAPLKAEKAEKADKPETEKPAKAAKAEKGDNPEKGRKAEKTAKAKKEKKGEKTKKPPPEKPPAKAKKPPAATKPAGGNVAGAK